MADGWRPKNKKLTAEEVFEKAKKDLAPFWIHSSPLIAPVPAANGGFTVFPFTPDFEEKLWLVGLVDVSSYSGQRTLTFLKEMHKRYSSYSLSVFALFWSSDRACVNAVFLERSTKLLGSAFPGALDPDLMLARALGFTLEESVLVHQKFKMVVRSSVKATVHFEETIQNSLRVLDPGLPLPLALDQNSLPGFEMEAVHFQAVEVPVQAHGIWKQEADRWTTTDPHATLEFKCKTSRFGLVARSASDTAVAAKVAIEVGGKWVREENFDEKLILDNEGRTGIRLEEAMLYPILKGMKGHQLSVVLKFSEADRVPVEIFSLRFAN